jgi:hypothetical protein
MKTTYNIYYLWQGPSIKSAHSATQSSYFQIYPVLELSSARYFDIINISLPNIYIHVYINSTIVQIRRMLYLSYVCTLKSVNHFPIKSPEFVKLIHISCFYQSIICCVLVYYTCIYPFVTDVKIHPYVTTGWIYWAHFF